MTIIVTGAAGFIGANIVQALNARGEKNIIAVDDLRPADKYRNLADLDISDYLDKGEFLQAFRNGRFGKVKAVFHEGACSDTMETDGIFMMANNYRYTMDLLDICTAQKVNFSMRLLQLPMVVLMYLLRVVSMRSHSTFTATLNSYLTK